MSHVVQIQTQIRDAEAVRAACRRLGLAEPVQGTTRLYSSEVTGLAVQLPGWRYPAVCQLDIGQIQYDNFQDHWGKRQELDRFLQSYAAEKTKLEARKRGHTVRELLLQDGSIKLTIQVTGGVA
jgi:hypothetical protein